MSPIKKKFKLSPLILPSIPPFRGWGRGLIFFLLLFSSCEKVIDINLNNAAKKYVIEGNITDQPGYCQIKISQTAEFNSSNNFPAVSGALVTITDNNGTPVILSETSAGNYQTSAINGSSGHSYTLSVTINNQVFTSSSIMPVLVNFDSLYVEELNGFGDAAKYANVVFRDPPGKGNAYHFIQKLNGKQNKTIFILDDNFSDGRLNNILLVNFQNSDDEDEIKSNDTLDVAMECVDMPVYNYWYSLDQGSTGGNNNATPGNPVSNITGGALGYFSAYTVQSKSIIVP